MQELERADSGLRSLASVQGALAIQAIHSFGSREQQARWLPGLLSGKLVGCFALTEHGHGSDPGGMETRAKHEGDHYILNGSKCWIGNASIADVKVVWAKDEDGHVGGFVVEKDAPGFRAQDIEGKFSLRMSRTSECWFENCRIPAENRLLKGFGPRRAAVMSFARALRYCLGGDWRGDRLLRNGAGLCKIARTIWPPNCGLPISATKTRLDGAGDYQGAIIGVASHAHGGDGLGASRANLAREAKQRLDGAGMRAEGARHPWRRRHHRSLPRDPPSHESRKRFHLRGYARHPYASHRSRHHGDQRLRRLVCHPEPRRRRRIPLIDHSALHP